MQIKPFTMSVIIGSAACNARCPFCISRMTPPDGITTKPEPINWKNWHQACTLALRSGVTTIMLTGKGEPTLFPEQVTEVLKRLKPYDFPIIELQTNAIPIADGKLDEGVYFSAPFGEYKSGTPPVSTLQHWFNLGLRTIAISNVGIDPELNQKVYLPYRKEYIDLEATIAKLHAIGFSVRLATVMINGGIDSSAKVFELIQFAKKNNVEQVSIRPVTKTHEVTKESSNTLLPQLSQKDLAAKWVDDNCVNEISQEIIGDYLKNYGTLLMTLPHGANVYDFNGQNICFTNCLTHDTNPDSIRQLIYRSATGNIGYSWEYSGAIIL